MEHVQLTIDGATWHHLRSITHRRPCARIIIRFAHDVVTTDSLRVARHDSGCGSDLRWQENMEFSDEFNDFLSL